MSLGLDNGVGLTPAMGYSSWNDCASEVTEARIKKVTRALIDTGLAAKGYRYVNVDEGWIASRRDTSGGLVADPQKFPSGMRALGDWVHSQVVPGHGAVMKYGLYTSRGTCQCSSKPEHLRTLAPCESYSRERAASQLKNIRAHLAAAGSLRRMQTSWQQPVLTLSRRIPAAGASNTMQPFATIPKCATR